MLKIVIKVAIPNTFGKIGMYELYFFVNEQRIGIMWKPDLIPD